MSEGHSCPHCGEKIKAADSKANPAFPFCSERCKMTDLGKWFSEDYRISRPTFEDDPS
ncbi:MAG: DNA gyrase inhibitor YacG [Planctomycetota bacterium]